ncbi:MAG: hypothetical protein MJ152_00640 [Clostridia bacterium]|nr:hypothetical protein [Clostridia bacterium]
MMNTKEEYSKYINIETVMDFAQIVSKKMLKDVKRMNISMDDDKFVIELFMQEKENNLLYDLFITILSPDEISLRTSNMTNEMQMLPNAWKKYMDRVYSECNTDVDVESTQQKL